MNGTVKALAWITLGAGAAAYLARRATAVARVHPELRGPWLYLPVGLPLPGLTVPVARAMTAAGERRAATALPPRRGVEVQERLAPGIDGPEVRVLVFKPRHRSPGGGGLLWIHGGGHVASRADDDAEFVASLADALGVPIVSVDYRLAWEAPFPGDLDDAAAASGWFRANAAEFGIDPDRIAVAGASAGGGLAAALAQRTTDEGRPFRAQVLLYPMLDDRTAIRPRPEGRGRFVWTPNMNLGAWTAYLGHRPAEDVPPPAYAAPGRRSDLAGLPPAWIGVGDLDLFYDEDVAYADRLVAGGVPCTLVTVEGMFHGADARRDLPPVLQDLRDSMVEALREALVDD